jgi:hypothetical protein
MIFTFDPENHIYRADGRMVHSVTQIGQGFRFNDEAVFLDARWYKPSGRDRGTDVHTAIEMINKKMVSVDDFAGSDREGFIRSYGTFLAATGFTPLLTEVLGYHRTLGYCGTIDCVGMIGDKLYLIDLKSGGRSKWYGVQLAAYDIMLHDSTTLFTLTDREALPGQFICEEIPNPVCGKKLERRILYLKESGKPSFEDGYKETPFSHSSWDNAWLSAVTLKAFAA